MRFLIAKFGKWPGTTGFAELMLPALPVRGDPVRQDSVTPHQKKLILNINQSDKPCGTMATQWWPAELVHNEFPQAALIGA